jgi:hypothetical protein
MLMIADESITAPGARSNCGCVGADPKLQEFQQSEHAFSSLAVLFRSTSLI